MPRRPTTRHRPAGPSTASRSGTACVLSTGHSFGERQSYGPHSSTMMADRSRADSAERGTSARDALAPAAQAARSRTEAEPSSRTASAGEVSATAGAAFPWMRTPAVSLNTMAYRPPQACCRDGEIVRVRGAHADAVPGELVRRDARVPAVRVTMLGISPVARLDLVAPQANRGAVALEAVRRDLVVLAMLDRDPRAIPREAVPHDLRFVAVSAPQPVVAPHRAIAHERVPAERRLHRVRRARN